MDVGQRRASEQCDVRGEEEGFGVFVGQGRAGEDDDGGDEDGEGEAEGEG